MVFVQKGSVQVKWLDYEFEKTGKYQLRLANTNKNLAEIIPADDCKTWRISYVAFTEPNSTNDRFVRLSEAKIFVEELLGIIDMVDIES